MQFAQLLRRRLKIASAAAQSDPHNTQTTKAVLAVLVEAITQQASILELVQSQVSDKVSNEEFKQVMGQKLSLREFLDYFKKVERIVEKMQVHSAVTQSKMNDNLQNKLDRFAEQLQDSLQTKLQQFQCQFQQQYNQLTHKKTHQEHNHQNLLQIKQQLSQLTDAVSKVESNYDQGINQLKKQLNEKMTEINKNGHNKGNEKLATVLSEVKQMQVYINQTHMELNNLMGSLARQQSRRSGQEMLVNRVQQCQQQLGMIREAAPGRWLWQWKPTTCSLTCQPLTSTSPPLDYLNECQTSIRIQRPGLHRLAFGYLLESHLSGQLIICVQNSQIFSMPFEGRSQSGICRASMLYCYLGACSLLSWRVQSRSGVTGFFEVQHL